MHDPLAMAAFLDRSIVKTVPHHVDIDTAGPTTGRTVAHPAPPATANVNVAVDVDAERFFRLFVDRLTQ
jgi:purine nucleosidase